MDKELAAAQKQALQDNPSLYYTVQSHFLREILAAEGRTADEKANKRKLWKMVTGNPILRGRRNRHHEGGKWQKGAA
jgi:hypothetical protein